jgi:hypothetical protein
VLRYANVKLLSRCPLRVAHVLWRDAAGALRMTVVCKATFLLEGEPRLAEAQEEPCEADHHWNDDPARSLVCASDLAPWKDTPEVLLVGHAFAPEGTRLPRLVARLVVNGAEARAARVDKRVEVLAGTEVSKFPLRYERADRLRVVGPRGVKASGEGPAGMGPVAASARAFACGLTSEHRAWLDSPRLSAAVPATFPRDYFNVAPKDQRLSELTSSTEIVLEQLHPQHPVLRAPLPHLTPTARIERLGKPTEELTLRADTLWIDTDRAVATLTWRGSLELAGAHEEGVVIVDMKRAIVDQDRAPTITRVLQAPLQAAAEPAWLAPPARPEPAVELRRPAARPLSIGEQMAGQSPSPPPVPAPAPARRPSPLPPRNEHVELLWHDPAALARARDAFGLKGGSQAKDAAPVPPERALAALLARDDLSREDLEDALRAAFSEDGTFAPPLVVARGVLSPTLDEVRRLRAALALAAPFASSRRAVATMLQDIHASLSTLDDAGPSGASVAAELGAQLARELEDANPSLPSGFLERGAARSLVEQRAFARRSVLGAPHVRATLRTESSEVPAYLTDSAARALPMFERFDAVALAELHASQDPFETQGVALRVIAVGRRISRPDART